MLKRLLIAAAVVAVIGAGVAAFLLSSALRRTLSPSVPTFPSPA